MSSSSPDHAALLADQETAEHLRRHELDLPRAHALQGSVADHFTRTLGPEHPDTLRAYSYLNAYHRLAGDFTRAAAEDFTLYTTAQRHLGPDHPVTLLIAHHLATSLRLTDHADPVLSHETWARREEVEGGWTSAVASHDAYLLDLTEAGLYDTALNGYEKLLDEITGRLGDTDPLSLLVVRNCCVALRQAGDPDAAHAVLTATLPQVPAERSYSRIHLLLQAAHAITLRHIGDLDASVALNIHVVEVHRERYGDNHPHTHASILNLANSLRASGELEQARVLERTAVELLTKRLRPGHAHVHAAFLNLGTTEALLGHAPNPSRPALTAGVTAELTAALPPTHSLRLAATLNAALDLKAGGNLPASAALYEQALTAYRTHRDPSHPDTLRAERGERAVIDIDLLPL